MKEPNKKAFLAQMRKLAVSPQDPYIRVYPLFVSYFRERKVISKADFVIAANFTYGWMPTILKLVGTEKDWRKAATLLTSAKKNRIESEDDLSFLMGLVNNSLVGVSKILHFVNPKAHAIWDSRVFRYLKKNQEEPYPYRISNVDNYLRYLEICDEIATWPGVDDEVARLRALLDQDLTTLRAIELTMWVNGKPQ